MRTAVAALVLTVATGCGGSTSGTAPGTGGTGAMGGSGGSGGTQLTGGSGGLGATGGVGATGGGPAVGQPPPPDPNAPVASGTQPTTLAITKLRLGYSDPFGNPDPNAWRDLGLNVDGLVSTKSSANHCQPQAGAVKSSVQTDGNEGIDNSWGSNLMPVLASLSSSPEADINSALSSGEFTNLIHLANLGPEPSQNMVTSAWFGGSKLATLPKWDGTDAWPVTSSSVVNGNIQQPVVAFPLSYVTAGTFVSAPPTDGPRIRLGQSFFGDLVVHRATIVMRVTGIGGSAKAVDGVIAGVLDTEELIAEMKKVAGSFDPTLCQGATFDSIAQQIRAASDLMKDGTNGDPSKLCDGISIGLGFEASAVMLGAVAAPEPTPPDPCGS